MLSFLVLSLFALQVLAFNITVGNRNLSVDQILAIPDSPVKTACATNCTDTSTKFAACADDATCLCSADTVASLLACESCMLNFLIATNKPAPDFRAGSNPVLGGYAAACTTANIKLAANQTALVLPRNWDGPFVAVLPFGTALVAVGFAGVLGISALYILSNM